ncbi:hypothetical protein QQZ08_012017 [Neonectria magnoliae]|uniref:C2H2-type domain-containing protein n=1 Tax=Neonectria magnoliae TaxID=2732573 RepID=A0ABR1H5K2_9HYPO
MAPTDDTSQVFYGLAQDTTVACGIGRLAALPTNQGNDSSFADKDNRQSSLHNISPTCAATDSDQDGPGDTQFTCRFCPLQFSKREGLLHHEKRHQGRLKCPYCPKRVPNPFSLSEHLRAHTDDKPFACDTCPRTYKRPQALKKHQKNYPPPDQQPHQQDMAQNTPVASNTGISKSFSVRQGDKLVSIVDTTNDNVDTDNHGDTISYNPPPMATENFLVQHPSKLMAPTDDTSQGFYDDSLPTHVASFFCTNLWDEILLAPPITVTTQQGTPGGKPENQEEGHLEAVYLNTSWVRI